MRGVGVAETSHSKALHRRRQVMTTQSSVHFFLSWAEERINEMDATLASLENKAAETKAEARVKADQFIAEMKKRRDEFESTVKKQAEAGEAAWDGAKVRLETEWKGFETETRKYLETFGKDMDCLLYTSPSPR